MSERKYDVVAGKVLPYMRQKHPDRDSLLVDFTENESRDLYIDGLPLMINHNDGICSDEEWRVGTVTATQVRGVDLRALATIENPTSDPYARMTSRAIANGTYKGLSLGIRTHIGFSGTKNVVTKVPEEVSVCEKGKRPGSDIEHFFPCRDTITEMYDDSRNDLRALVQRFNYHVDIPEEKRDMYIDALTRLSQKRLETIVAAESLYPRPPPQRVFDAMSETTATQTEKASVTAPVPPASEQTSAASQTDSESATLPLQRGPVSNVEASSAHKLHEELLAAKKEAVEMKKNNLELLKAKEELDKIKEERQQEIKRKFETILNAFKEKASTVPDMYSEAEINAIAADAEQFYNQNPSAGISNIERALTVATKASDTQQKLTRDATQKMKVAIEQGEKRQLDEMSMQLANLRQRELEYDTQRQAFMNTSSANNRFEKSIQPPEKAATNAGQSAPAAAAVPPPQQQQQTMSSSGYTRPANIRMADVNTLFSKASAKSTSYDAIAATKKYIELTGKIPSKDTIARGVQVEFTGQYKASAHPGGEQVPIVKMGPEFSQDVYLDPEAWNPDFFAQCVDQMNRLTGTERNFRFNNNTTVHYKPNVPYVLDNTGNHTCYGEIKQGMQPLEGVINQPGLGYGKQY